MAQAEEASIFDMFGFEEKLMFIGRVHHDES